MLDTYGRKYINPLIKFISNFFLKLGLTPNQVTVIAFLLGISSALFVYLQFNILGVLLLWLSGLLDAVDGTMARLSYKTSNFGTLLDITFDRIVEISIILSLGVININDSIFLVLLCCSIILSMTIFLTVGALSNKDHMKSFYYQAGLAERTEGFILFSLMILFQDKLVILSITFSFIVLITALQRFLEAKRILG